MIWIDGLDVPFIQSLQVISFEPFAQQAHAAQKQPRYDSSPTAWRGR